MEGPHPAEASPNSTAEESAVPVINIPHHLPRKAPPHMRRLNVQVTSPSDNLSPCSQKVMNIAKGPKPRSFRSMLGLKGAARPDAQCVHETSCAAVTREAEDVSEPEEDEMQSEAIDGVTEEDLDENGDETMQLSQSPSTRSPARGGLVRQL